MDDLTPDDLRALTALRRDLHRRPELSGAEETTAETIAQALQALGLEVVSGLGGHGVAGIVSGHGPGRTVLLRCELDALPIAETGRPAWRSETPGVAHLCGHDGHMATMLGAVRLLRRDPPAKGRVVAMFQPAEEDGSGAIAVCDDPRFAPLAPDWAFALHNEPDVPRGVVHVPDGLASAASVGLAIALTGVEAHACAPETGRSPAPEIARLMDALPALSRGTFPDPDYRLVTLTHARLGAPAFGIAPGRGEVFATLRTTSDAALWDLEEEARALTGAPEGLTVEITTHDRFLAGINDPEAASILRRAAARTGLEAAPGDPLRASEDFGRFGHDCPSALLLLGAGPGPALHNPDYDFDDDLIAPGAAILAGAARAALARGG